MEALLLKEFKNDMNETLVQGEIVKALGLLGYRKAIPDIIEVVDEDVAALVAPQRADAPDTQLKDGLAAPFRADATTMTPRTDGRQGAAERVANAKKPRRPKAKQPKNRDPRNVGSPRKAAAIGDNGSPALTSINRPKWGVTYDG